MESTELTSEQNGQILNYNSQKLQQSENVNLCETPQTNEACQEMQQDPQNYQSQNNRIAPNEDKSENKSNDYSSNSLDQSENNHRQQSNQINSRGGFDRRIIEDNKSFKSIYSTYCQMEGQDSDEQQKTYDNLENSPEQSKFHSQQEEYERFKKNVIPQSENFFENTIREQNLPKYLINMNTHEVEGEIGDYKKKRTHGFFRQSPNQSQNSEQRETSQQRGVPVERQSFSQQNNNNRHNKYDRDDTYSEEEEEDEQEYLVESIQSKQVKDNQVYYEVKWQDYSEDENTWEPLDNLWEQADMIIDFEKGKHTAPSQRIDLPAEFDNNVIDIVYGHAKIDGKVKFLVTYNQGEIDCPVWLLKSEMNSFVLREYSNSLINNIPYCRMPIRKKDITEKKILFKPKLKTRSSLAELESPQENNSILEEEEEELDINQANNQSIHERTEKKLIRQNQMIPPESSKDIQQNSEEDISKKLNTKQESFKTYQFSQDDQMEEEIFDFQKFNFSTFFGNDDEFNSQKQENTNRDCHKNQNQQQQQQQKSINKNRENQNSNSREVREEFNNNNNYYKDASTRFQTEKPFQFDLTSSTRSGGIKKEPEHQQTINISEMREQKANTAANLNIPEGSFDLNDDVKEIKIRSSEQCPVEDTIFEVFWKARADGMCPRSKLFRYDELYLLSLPTLVAWFENQMKLSTKQLCSANQEIKHFKEESFQNRERINSLRGEVNELRYQLNRYKGSGSHRSLKYEGSADQNGIAYSSKNEKYRSGIEFSKPDKDDDYQQPQPYKMRQGESVRSFLETDEQKDLDEDFREFQRQSREKTESIAAAGYVAKMLSSQLHNSSSHIIGIKRKRGRPRKEEQITSKSYY